jgi:hypothetical protein
MVNIHVQEQVTDYLLFTYLLTVNLRSYFCVYKMLDKRCCSEHTKNCTKHQLHLPLNHYCTVNAVHMSSAKGKLLYSVLKCVTILKYSLWCHVSTLKGHQYLYKLMTSSTLQLILNISKV